jgi:hypothetical protein
MKPFDLLGGRALRLAVGGLGFWQFAIPLIASGLGALFGNKKKSSSSGSSGSGGGNMDAMNAILAQKQAQYAQQQPLRDMLLRQYAGMLPTYMKQQDPGYAQWLQGSAPGAQQAMTQYAQSRNPFSSM